MLLDGVSMIFKPAWKWGFNQAGLKCKSSDYCLQADGYYPVQGGGDDTFGSQDDELDPGLIFIRLNEEKDGVDIARLVVLYKKTDEDGDAYYAAFGYGVEASDESVAKDQNIATLIESIIGDYGYELSGSPASFYFDTPELLLDQQNFYFYLYGQTVTKEKVIQESEDQIFEIWKQELLNKMIEESVIEAELDQLIQQEQQIQLDSLVKAERDHQLVLEKEQAAARAREEETAVKQLARQMAPLDDEASIDFDEDGIRKCIDNYIEENKLLMNLQNLVLSINKNLGDDSPFPEGALGSVSAYVEKFFANLIRISRFVDVQIKKKSLTVDELQSTIEAFERAPQAEVLGLVSNQLYGLIEFFHSNDDVKKWMDYLRSSIMFSIASVLPVKLNIENVIGSPVIEYPEFSQEIITSLEQFSQDLGGFIEKYNAQDAAFIIGLNKLDQLISQLIFLSRLPKHVDTLILHYDQYLKKFSQLTDDAVNSDEKLYEFLQHIIYDLDCDGADWFHHRALGLHQEQLARALLKEPWHALPPPFRQRHVLEALAGKILNEFGAKRSPLQELLNREEKPMSRDLNQYAGQLNSVGKSVEFFEFHDERDPANFESKRLKELLAENPVKIGDKGKSPGLYICCLSGPDAQEPQIVILAQDKEQADEFHAFGVGVDIENYLSDIKEFLVKQRSTAKCISHDLFLVGGCPYIEVEFLNACINQYCKEGRSVNVDWMEAFFSGVQAASIKDKMNQANYDLKQVRAQLESTLREAESLQSENKSLIDLVGSLEKENRRLETDWSKSQRWSVLELDQAQLSSAKLIQAGQSKLIQKLQEQVGELTRLLSEKNDGSTHDGLQHQLEELQRSMSDMTEQNNVLSKEIESKESELQKLRGVYDESDGLVCKNLALQDELDILREKLRDIVDSQQGKSSLPAPGISLADELAQTARKEFQDQLDQAVEAFELTKIMQLCQDLSAKFTALHGYFLQAKISEQEELKKAADEASTEAHMSRGLVARLVNKRVDVDHSSRDARNQELEAKDAEFRKDMLSLTSALHGCLSEFNRFIARITASDKSKERESYVENKSKVIEGLNRLLYLQIKSIEKVLQTILPESESKKVLLRRELLKGMIQKSLEKEKALAVEGVDIQESISGGLPRYIFRILSLGELADPQKQSDAGAIYTLCNQLLVHLVSLQKVTFSDITVGEFCSDFMKVLRNAVSSALYVSGEKYTDWKEERSTLCGDAIARMECWLKEGSVLRNMFFRGRAKTNTSNEEARAHAAVSRPGREANSRETDTIALPSQVGGVFTSLLMWINHLLVLEQRPSDQGIYKEIDDLIRDFVRAYMDDLAVIHHKHYVDIDPGDLKSMTDEAAQQYIANLAVTQKKRDQARAEANKEYHQLFSSCIQPVEPLINDILKGADPSAVLLRLREILKKGIEQRKYFVVQAEEIRRKEIEEVMGLPEMSHVVPGVVRFQSLFRNYLEKKKQETGCGKSHGITNPASTI